MTQTTQPLPVATLPDWAFRALAAHAIDSLIDRTAHETIMVTRRGRPELVLVGHEEWEMLTATAKRASDDPPDVPAGGGA